MKDFIQCSGSRANYDQLKIRTWARWPPINVYFLQCVATLGFNHFHNFVPDYKDDVVEICLENYIFLRRSYLKFKPLFHNCLRLNIAYCIYIHQFRTTFVTKTYLNTHLFMYTLTWRFKSYLAHYFSIWFHLNYLNMFHFQKSCHIFELLLYLHPGLHCYLIF